MTLRYNDGPQCHGLPYIEGSLNGVRGAFVIDTGANEPVLTMTAVRRCGISFSENTSGAVDTDAGVISVKRVRGATVELAPGVTVHWSNVYVDPRDYPWLGLIDYKTLKACHATVNSSDKTITICR